MDGDSSLRGTAWVKDQLWVLIVGGIPFGVLVGGVGSRLAMFVLRLTSNDSVRGVQSDDDFTIGEFTLSGTYNLLILGAAVGLIGAIAYRLVEPRLVGPTWFRRMTLGLASGAVVGSMLIHDDGIDFHVLEPLWLAIGLFAGLPFLFGLGIGPAVDAVARSGRRSAGGRRQWLPAVLLVLFFPFVLFPLGFVLAGLCVIAILRSVDPIERVRQSTPFGVVVRCAWLAIAVAGAAALVGDVQALA